MVKEGALKLLTTAHYISIFATLVLISIAGVYTARLVKTSSDFTVGGRKIGPFLVSGSLVGGFVGGTSTIGTAQMAFHFGLCGMWFTLGAGLSCLLMAFLLARPLREKKVETISQFLAATYGQGVAPWVAVYTSVGMFIQVCAQVLAAVPLLTVLFGMHPTQAALAAVGLIILYVICGGFWAASMVGLIKLVLIYLCMLLAGVIALFLAGGASGLAASLPAHPYLELLPRGIGKELASIFSVVVGFASTQSYLQPLFAASGVRAARRGALLAGALIPVIGIAAVLVGMFMRAQHPDMNPAAALPRFIFTYMPPWLGGVAAATLLVSLVITGAALTLGVSTVLARDVYSRFRPQARDREQLFVSRGLVLLVGLGVLAMVTANIHSLILEWAFLSMALRGVTVFVPLAVAIFLAGRAHPFWGRVAVALAPLLTIVWAIVLPRTLDPLYIGMAISAVIIGLGITSNARRLHHRHGRPG